MRRVRTQDHDAIQRWRPLHLQHAAQYAERPDLPAPARPIDERVTSAFLDAVAPAELEAWERAQTARRQAAATLDRAEAQQVERLRYQAILAERQFNRVDPDNRLVASELERRWESALRELRQAEEALARRRASTYEPPSLTPEEHIEFRNSRRSCRNSGVGPT